MRLLVCSHAHNFLHTDDAMDRWRREHEIVFNDSESRPDAIISRSITAMEETFRAIQRWPEVPMFAYHWDCYSWVWTNPRPREYDYHRYGELLSRATEVWVPSLCTGNEATKWWGLKNWRVILSSAPLWECDDTEDHGYAFCSLRVIPDAWCGMFERACEEIGIPYISTSHACSRQDYEDQLAHCRFIVSHYQEASTGGLSLLEAYYLGKPCLVTDSPRCGARDYLGDRAVYFHGRSYDDFKSKLSEMHDRTPKVADDHRQWVRDHFTDDRMFQDMIARIHANTP